MRLVTALFLSIFSTTVFAGIDCNTNCESWAGFNYPCPNWRNPTKVCKGVEPSTYAVCASAKVASCELWQKAADAIEAKVKPMMIDSFNAQVWAQATTDGERTEYMIKCEAAFVAVSAALGAELGGPWGAAVTGGVGTFVGFQICNQSTKW